MINEVNKFDLQNIHNNKLHNVYYLINSFSVVVVDDDDDDDDDNVVVERVMFVMLHLFYLLNVSMMMNPDILENEMMIILNVM